VTEEDPLRVEVEHRGRRRRVPLVLSIAVDGTPVAVDGQPVGRLIGSVTIEVGLPGGHELTERFVEEMAEDLGPAEGDDA
jgi:hypothetical protein